MPTVQMNLTLPDTTTRGPDYVALNNDAFLTIDSHDHTTGRGQRLPTAALDLNADLSLNDFGLSRVRSVRLTPQSAPLDTPSDVGAIYAVAGDLYYNNSLGVPVQLTQGSTINVSSIGGIGGDYSGSAAQITYDESIQSYNFFRGTGQFGDLRAANLFLQNTLLSRIVLDGGRSLSIESSPFGASVVAEEDGRILLDYVSGAAGESDRIELLPAGQIPLLVGASLLHVADNRLPLQLSTSGAGDDTYLGINKNGAVGLAVGYTNATTGTAGTLTGTGGVIRMLNTDPLLFAHQGAVSGTWRAAGLTVGPEDGAGPQASLTVRSTTSPNLRVDALASAGTAQLQLRGGASGDANVSLGVANEERYRLALSTSNLFSLVWAPESIEAMRYDPSEDRWTFRKLSAPSATVTTLLSAGSLNASGALNVGGISSLAQLNATNINANSAAVTGGVSANSVTTQILEVLSNVVGQSVVTMANATIAPLGATATNPSTKPNDCRMGIGATSVPPSATMVRSLPLPQGCTLNSVAVGIQVENPGQSYVNLQIVTTDVVSGSYTTIGNSDTRAVGPSEVVEVGTGGALIGPTTAVILRATLIRETSNNVAASLRHAACNFIGPRLPTGRTY